MLSSSLILRRFCGFSATATYSSSFNPAAKKKRLVFLVSPLVSAAVLVALFNASCAPDSLFEIAAIVTQPPSGRDRGRKVMPSPVAQHVFDRGFPFDLIFTPARAVEDGAKETGVSLAFTVRALDAGPVIACDRMEVDNHIKVPGLLELLFDQAYKLLIRELPSIFEGSAMVKAEPQDDSKTTLARKVRAFAGWPGTRAKVMVFDHKNGQQNIVELKIITTRIYSNNNIQSGEIDDMIFTKGSLEIPLGGGTALEYLLVLNLNMRWFSALLKVVNLANYLVPELQLPGKKVTSAAAFWNGL